MATKLCTLTGFHSTWADEVQLLQAGAVCGDRADESPCHPHSLLGVLSPPLHLAPSQAYPEAAISPNPISWSLAKA